MSQTSADEDGRYFGSRPEPEPAQPQRRRLLSVRNARWAAVVVLLAASGAVVLYAGSDTNAYLAAQTANAASIASLRAQASSMATPSTSASSSTGASVVVDEVQTAGAKVAQLQNTYRDLRSGDSKVADNAKALDVFFASTAKNARVPWYSADTSVGASKSAYAWSFAPSYAADPHSVAVVWICKETATGQLLAWANATYSVADKTFSKVSWAQTARGRQLAGSSNDQGVGATSAAGSTATATGQATAKVTSTKPTESYPVTTYAAPTTSTSR